MGLSSLESRGMCHVELEYPTNGRTLLLRIVAVNKACIALDVAIFGAAFQTRESFLSSVGKSSMKSLSISNIAAVGLLWFVTIRSDVGSRVGIGKAGNGKSEGEQFG